MYYFHVKDSRECQASNSVCFCYIPRLFLYPEIEAVPFRNVGKLLPDYKRHMPEDGTLQIHRSYFAFIPSMKVFKQLMFGIHFLSSDLKS
jgi:hypothetical protein